MSNEIPLWTSGGNWELHGVPSSLPNTFVGVVGRGQADFYITPRKPLCLPEVFYGAEETSAYAKRVVKTWRDRGKQMGILLCGQKGTGKTIDAKAIAIEAKCPTIIVDSAHGGAPYGAAKFASWVTSIQQPCVFVFDEYDKVYRDDAQEGLLPLLDGISPTQHLFIFTSNTAEINRYMRSRPSRIFYTRQYFEMSSERLREVVAGELGTTYEESGFAEVAPCLPLTIDIVLAVCGEMKRHGVSALEAADDMGLSIRKGWWSLSGTVTVSDVFYVPHAVALKYGWWPGNADKWAGQKVVPEHLKEGATRIDDYVDLRGFEFAGHREWGEHPFVSPRKVDISMGLGQDVEIDIPALRRDSAWSSKSTGTGWVGTNGLDTITVERIAEQGRTFGDIT